MADIQLPDGNFVRIPDYALESTQEKMLKIMEIQLGKNAKSLKLYQDMLEQAKADGKDRKESTKRTAQRNKKRNQTLRELLKETEENNKNVKRAMDAGRDMGSAFRMMGSLGTAAAALAIRFTSIAQETLVGFGETLTNLTQQGVGLSDARGSALGLISDLQRLGFTSAEASNTMAAFSSVVQTLGKRDFGMIQKNFAELTGYGTQFGMTMSEASEILNEDLELRQKLGILQTMDQRQAARNSRELFRMQMESASMLGRSIDEIRKLSMGVMEDPIAAITAQQIAMSISENAAEEFSKQMLETTSALGGMQLDDSLTAAIMRETTALIPFQGSEGTKLLESLALAGPIGAEIRAQLDRTRDLANRAAQGDESALYEREKAMENLLTSIRGYANLTDAQLKSLKNMQAVDPSNEFLMATVRARAQLIQYEENMNKAGESYVDAIMNSAATFRQAFASIRGQIGSGLTSLTAAFGEPMNRLAKAFSEPGEEFAVMTGKMEPVSSVFDTLARVGYDVSKALLSLFGPLGDTETTTNDLRKSMNSLIIQLGNSVIKFINDFKKGLGEDGFEGWVEDVGKKIQTFISTAGLMISAMETMARTIMWIADWFTDTEEVLDEDGNLSTKLGIDMSNVVITAIALPIFYALGKAAIRAILAMGSAWIMSTIFGGMMGDKDSKGGSNRSRNSGRGGKMGPRGSRRGIPTAGRGGMGAGGLTALGAGLSRGAPYILGGALVISGAIAILAGGIGLAGKMLPPFVRILEDLAEVDGKNLKDVGKGLYHLSSGMMVFSTIRWASSMFDLATAFTDLFTKLFGGKSSLESLQDFSRLNLDPIKVKTNTQAIVEYAKGMQTLSMSSRTTAMGSIMGAIVDGLSNIFRFGRSPYENLREFSQLDLNLERTRNNALVVSEFTRAMMDMARVPGGLRSISTAIAATVDGLVTFFGGNLPLDKIQEFGELNLSTRITDNARIVSDYGNALASMYTVAGDSAELGKTADHLIRMADAYERFSQLNTGRMSAAVGAIKELNTAIMMGREQPAPDSTAVSAPEATAAEAQAQMEQMGSTGNEDLDKLIVAMVESNRTTHRLLRELNESVQNM